MSIRFPKKNIAQSQFDRSKSKLVKPEAKPETSLLPAIPELQKREESTECPGAIWHGELYPHKLFQLHSDIELFFYQQDKLSPKDREELAGRMPFSLDHAEKEADKLLFKFVQDKINHVGVEAYSRALSAAVGDEVKVLFALRCMIAASSNEKVRQRIQIFRSEKMESADFFPESCKRVGEDPETGLEMIYYVDRPNKEDKNVYWRSLNHQGKQPLMREILGPKLTKRDRMPTSFFEEMQFILADKGIKVDSHEGAWSVLNERSKYASIENRILARIMYLIANATVNKEIYKLPNKQP